MKILFLTHRLPYPPNDGARLRPFNIIKYLATKHEITVASLLDSKEELEKTELLKQEANCKIIYCLQNPPMAKLACITTLLFPNAPLSCAYFYSTKLKKIIKDRLNEEKFDLIYVYSSPMAQYVVNQNGHIPKILDLCNVDSAKWLEYAKATKFPFSTVYKLEGIRLRKYEQMINKKFNHSLVISSQEKELLESITGDGIKIDILPNGVDYQFFKGKSTKGTDSALIFTGVMDNYANIEGVNYFYKEIFPLIKKEIKDVQFYIVGRNPHKSIKELAQKDKSVIVTGKVDDVRPYFEKATVCVVPLRIAQGVQNKILEAMAMGVPVVSTKKAIEGIKAKDDMEVLRGDTPKEFAVNVIKLLKNKALRDKFALNARTMIEKNYNWEEIVEGLNVDILEKKIKEPIEKIRIPQDTFYRTKGKRILDIFVAIIGFIVFTPLMAIIAGLIKLSSCKDPVIFKQIRVGQDGEFFTFYKFRTMKNGAEVKNQSGENGEIMIKPTLTSNGDKRVTFIGKILRKTALDELPQLVSVLKGDMSIVSPRPERPFFVTQHGCLQGKRIHVKPGLFCLPEIVYGFSDDNGSGRGLDLSKEEGQIQRANLDIEYVEKYSFGLDIWLIIKMAWKILLREFYFSKLLSETNGNGNGHGKEKIKGYIWTSRTSQTSQTKWG